MYYRPINRDLQRLESVSRSPIFAQFSETLNGVSTLRAYNQQVRVPGCLHRTVAVVAVVLVVFMKPFFLFRHIFFVSCQSAGASAGRS